jgi:glycosyltransferase involved in cell wall biosynthesis
MKIVVLNTYESGGGAAIAAKRISEALKENVTNISIQTININSHTKLDKLKDNLRLMLEKSLLWLFLKSKSNLFKFSLANTGKDISMLKVVNDADIIHLHWTNNGFLSLSDIQKLAVLGKPIVWTMHDMWSFTGGCHYSDSCIGFKSECHSCPFLFLDILSKNQFNFKKNLYKQGNFHFIGCSNWIANLAKESNLNITDNVQVIHNPIPSEKFRVLNKSESRKHFEIEDNKFVVLFTAANLNDPRKGLNYLLKIWPKVATSDFQLLLIGEAKQPLNIPKTVSYLHLGFVDDSLMFNRAICSASVFACPSQEDNLPNTVMESLVCGIPVLAWDLGGLNDMVNHKINGFLANFKSAEKNQELTNGLNWLYENREKFDSNEISKACFDKFSYAKISKAYADLYEKILTETN